MKIIITGSSGFIGANLVRYFKKHQYDVIGLDLIMSDTTSIVGDINDISTLLANTLTDDCDIVIHCAAITTLGGERTEYAWTNIRGTLKVVDFTSKRSLKCIVFSSMLAYELDQGRISSKDENYLYADSKLKMEQELFDLNKQNFLILRPTSIWGPGFSEPYSTFFKVISNGVFSLPIGYEGLKSFGYIGHLVQQVHYTVVNFEKKIGISEVYWLTDHEPYDLKKFAEIIAAVYRKRVRYFPTTVFKLLAFLGEFSDMIPMNRLRLKNLLNPIVVVEKNPLPYDSISLEDAVNETVEYLSRQS